MQCPPDQHAHVHPEVVDLKYLGLGEEQYEHSQELGYRNTTEYL